MRAPVALLLFVLLAVAGCATTTSPVSADPGTAATSPTVDVRENGRSACLAVRKVADVLSANVLSMNNGQLAAKAPGWAGTISQAGRGAADPTLQTSLLSLADVVRGWATRAPDRTSLRGFQNDLQVACRPYLSGSSGASAS